MQGDCRSHDLDDASERMTKIYFSGSMVKTYSQIDDYVRFRISDFGILKSQTLVSFVGQSSEMEDLLIHVPLINDYDLCRPPKFGFPKCQTPLSSILQSFGLDDLQTLVLSINNPAFTLGVWPFNLDQRSYGPPLNQRSISPSGLWTSEISNLKLHPFPNGFFFEGCDPLTCVLLIWRSRITSGLYLEYMDICHISLISDGYESLRDFTRSPQIHATSPLDLSAQIHFGSSGFDSLSSQTETPLQFS